MVLQIIATGSMMAALADIPVQVSRELHPGEKPLWICAHTHDWLPPRCRSTLIPIFLTIWATNKRRNALSLACRRWLNNRAENSYQPFRRREGAMARFRDTKTLQKFAAAHASIHNHFNHDRHLNRRDIFKQNRAAALAQWRQIGA